MVKQFVVYLHIKDLSMEIFVRYGVGEQSFEVMRERNCLQEAIEQINRKNYSLPFATDGKEIIKIGINFSTKDRTISDWIVE